MAAVDSVNRLYNEVTINLQKMSGKTLKSRMQDCVLALVVSAIIIAIVILLRIFHINFAEFFSGQGVLLGIVGILYIAVGFVIAPIMFLLAPIMMIRYATMPRKTVVCPICSASHTVYAGVSSYICDQCGNLFLMSESIPQAPLFAVECPQCHSGFSLDEGISKMRCNNCGVNMAIEQKAVKRTDKHSICPLCGAKVWEDMYLCPSCGALHTDPNKELMEAYKKTDNAFTMMFAKMPVTNRWGFDAITQRNLTSVGQYAKAVWLRKEVRDRLANKDNKTNQDLIDFKNVLNALVMAEAKKSPMLLFDLSELLYLTYEKYINEKGEYFFYFLSRDEIKRYRESCLEISKLYQTIAAGEADWPEPIIDLEFTKSAITTNRQMVYLTRISNIEEIRRFIDRFAMRSSKKEELA